MSLNADWMDWRIVSTSLARNILPRPLMAACQRSSIIVGSLAVGVGQVGGVAKTSTANGFIAVGYSLPRAPSVMP